MDRVHHRGNGTTHRQLGGGGALVHLAGEGGDLLVADPLLAVAHGDELPVDQLSTWVGVRSKPRCLAAIDQGVAAAVFAQHQAARGDAHRRGDP